MKRKIGPKTNLKYAGWGGVGCNPWMDYLVSDPGRGGVG